MQMIRMRGSIIFTFQGRGKKFGRVTFQFSSIIVFGSLSYVCGKNDHQISKGLIVQSSHETNKQFKPTNFVLIMCERYGHRDQNTVRLDTFVR